MDFNKKTILITGASSGIGRAIAGKLAEYDCKLILTARRIELLHEIKNHHGNKAEIDIYQCDVSKKEEVQNTYDKIKQAGGSIDIAILNSGVGIAVTTDDFKSEYAEKTFGANFFGVVYWIEAMMNDFIKKKDGIIAATSSLADNRAYGLSFYNPSKAALTIFLEGLRLDMKKYNIRILNIRPGFVKTPMTDQNNFKMPFLISPEKAADYIIEGIKKEKKIIQFPWQMVLLTRIIGLLPLTVYEFLAGKEKKK